VNVKQAGNGQTPSEMEEDCIGSQGSLWTVALEEEEEEEEEEEKKKRKRRRTKRRKRRRRRMTMMMKMIMMLMRAIIIIIIILKNKKEKTCTLIDVAIPADRNVVQKEGKKKLKYMSFV
jgi:CO dehydrogenase/acetyl-CoA synthase beta subunit